MEPCFICFEPIKDYRLCCQCAEIICMGCGKNLEKCPFCRNSYNINKGKKLKKLLKLETISSDKIRSMVYNDIGLCYIFLDRINYLEKAIEYFEKSDLEISKKNIDFLKFLGLSLPIEKYSNYLEKDFEYFSSNINHLYFLNEYNKVWLEFLISKGFIYPRYVYAQRILFANFNKKHYLKEIKELSSLGCNLSKKSLAHYYTYYSNNADKALILYKELSLIDNINALIYLYYYYKIKDKKLSNDYLNKAYDLKSSKAELILLQRHIKSKSIDFFDIILKSEKKDYYLSKLSRVLEVEDVNILKYDEEFY